MIGYEYNLTDSGKTEPVVVRLMDFNCHEANDYFLCSAKVFSFHFSEWNITWLSDHNPNLARFSLVEICADHREYGNIKSVTTIPVARFDVDLFSTVPMEWVDDRMLLADAQSLFCKLSPRSKHIFNTIFWSNDLFIRFLRCPSSINGHHNYRYGNLRHTIQVAKLCLAQANEIGQLVSTDLLLLSAFLHDAGKALDYQDGYGTEKYAMTDLGKIVGHGTVNIMLIGRAIAELGMSMQDNFVMTLIHSLTAAPNAEHFGIRAPMSMEANILSLADRTSGEWDLVRRNFPRSGEIIGRYHKHLKGKRPLVLRSTIR